MANKITYSKCHARHLNIAETMEMLERCDKANKYTCKGENSECPMRNIGECRYVIMRNALRHLKRAKRWRWW